MGNSLQVFMNYLGLSYYKKEARILMVGLDGAGKTSILYKMKLGEVVTTIPTIGFNVETINLKNLTITVWDVGGRDKSRILWRHYYTNTQALILVVDSQDHDRIKEARDELARMLNEDELKDIPVLVLANKQDLKNTYSAEQVRKEINLDSLQRETNCFETSAITGQGLSEAFDWLAKIMNNKK